MKIRCKKERLTIGIVKIPIAKRSVSGQIGEIDRISSQKIHFFTSQYSVRMQKQPLSVKFS
jgi:hypothetical protein